MFIHLTRRPDCFEWAIFYCSSVTIWWGSHLFWLTPCCILNVGSYGRWVGSTVLRRWCLLHAPATFFGRQFQHTIMGCVLRLNPKKSHVYLALLASHLQDFPLTLSTNLLKNKICVSTRNVMMRKLNFNMHFSTNHTYSMRRYTCKSLCLSTVIFSCESCQRSWIWEILNPT